MEKHTIRTEFSKHVIKGEINLPELLSFDGLQYLIGINSYTLVTFLTYFLACFFLSAHLPVGLLGLVKFVLDNNSAVCISS